MDVLITVLLIVIGIGVMNSMWIAIRNAPGRSGPCGHRHAAPAVLGMFLIESLVLGLFPTAVGATMGALIAGGLNLLHIKVPQQSGFFFFVEASCSTD